MKYALITFPLLFLFLFLYLIFPKTASPDIVKFLILSQVIFLLYLFFLYITKKISFSFRNHKKLFIYFIVIGLLIRISVSFFSGDISYLSDDVYRYIWEGKLVTNNYNPYIVSPEDMLSTPLADSTIYPKINHPWHVTIYPPISQYLFAISYIIGGDSLSGFKLLALLFELLSLLLMYYFVKIYRLPDWSFLIYLFSPFIIIEFLFSNHLDIFGLPFLVGALILLKDYKKHIYTLSLLLAIGVLIKFYILFFIPFIFFFFGAKEKLKFIITFTITILLLYLPFILSSGFNVFGSLLVYLDKWQYNGSIYLLLKQIFSQETARYIFFAVFFCSYIPLLLLKRFKNNPMLQSFIIFGVYIILTPTIFNWYLLWIIPFMIYYRSIAFLILSGTCMLSYHGLIGIYDNGVWLQMPILTLISYLPFFIILIYEIYKFYKPKKVNII